MSEPTGRAAKRRLGEDQKRARRARFLDDRRSGVRADEIAAREGLSPRRVREIVREARFERRRDDRTPDAAPLETEGLYQFLQQAGRLVATADSATVRALARVIDRLDRVIPAARATGAE
jgi:hypothetical protein